ncbi:MAG: transporter substrate-binding domain-containing protein [Telluria sp.]
MINPQQDVALGERQAYSGGMNRALTVALVFALALPARATGVVQLTGHPNWPPFSWQDGGKIVGIGADLAEIVFNDVGLSVRAASSGNWKRAQAQVEFGAVDVLVAAYQTRERSVYMAYPKNAFMEDVNVLWVERGRQFAFREWADLKGKKGTAMLGESYGQRFDDYIKQHLQIDWVSTPGQSLQKLSLGRADYYPFSLHGGMIQIRQMGLGKRITYIDKPISAEGIYITISRKSKYIAYLPRIDAAIKARLADGTVDRLIRKHTPD